MIMMINLRGRTKAPDANPNSSFLSAVEAKVYDASQIAAVQVSLIAKALCVQAARRLSSSDEQIQLIALSFAVYELGFSQNDAAALFKTVRTTVQSRLKSFDEKLEKKLPSKLLLEIREDLSKLRAEMELR